MVLATGKHVQCSISGNLLIGNLQSNIISKQYIYSLGSFMDTKIKQTPIHST